MTHGLMEVENGLWERSKGRKEIYTVDILVMINVQIPGFIKKLVLKYLIFYKKYNRRPDILLVWVRVWIVIVIVIVILFHLQVLKL
jgi:hypothetical protein